MNAPCNSHPIWPAACAALTAALLLAAAQPAAAQPGWQTLWRGWQKLDLMTLGASLTQTEDLNCG